MAKKAKPALIAPRKRRADAIKNREHILSVAKAVFTRRGVDTSMDEIAKLARVGPGTLYRHFPTRDELLAAVYRSEIERLAEAQKKLSAELEPIEALRSWLLLFIDYIAAKRIIKPALDALAGESSELSAQSSQVLADATRALATNAVAKNQLRRDVDPMDMLRALYGVATAGSTSDWPERARRFVDILVDGARPLR
jgi:AcrR family transcriptional regulator